jgi:hypothetical protein
MDLFYAELSDKERKKRDKLVTRLEEAKSAA